MKLDKQGMWPIPPDIDDSGGFYSEFHALLVFGGLRKTVATEFKDNGDAVHIYTTEYKDFKESNKKVSKTPKYKDNDPVPLYDIDNNSESDWSKWAQARNRLAYDHLNSRKKK